MPEVDVNNLAPVVLFVYFRPTHTRKTVEALLNNHLASDTEITIFSDAPKNADAEPQVAAVREYLKTISGFKKVTIVERENNLGLAASIIDGVTSIVEQHGKVIVLEDDLITSKYFLQYMNEALDKYQHENNVYSITGHSFTNDVENIDSTYFLKIISSWSWATWRDKWKVFQQNPKLLQDILNNSQCHKDFNYDDSYPYTQMIKSQLNSKIDSWAIYWYASVYPHKGLTLYPSRSLVSNIGNDETGTHCGNNLETVSIVDFNYELTDVVDETPAIRKTVADILRQHHGKITLLKKIKRRIKKLLF